MTTTVLPTGAPSSSVARVRAAERIHPLDIPPAPPGYVWSLPLLYAVACAVVVLLYFPCRWFAEAKRRSNRSWLSVL